MGKRTGRLLKKARLAGLAVLVAGAAHAAPMSGVYSNVCIERETDDLDGVAIQFAVDAPPAGVFWLCEGGCGWPEPMTTIRLSGDTITFTVAEVSVDGAGKIVRSTPFHYRGRFTTRELILTSDWRGFGRAILTRRREQKPTLARSPQAGRNDRSTPVAYTLCR